MKVIIEVNEKYDAELMLKSKDLAAAISDYYQYLRSQVKHIDEQNQDSIEDARKAFIECLENNQVLDYLV